MRRRIIAMLLAMPALAQHDISKVDPVPPDGAIATPMPEARKRQMKRYDIPDLTGATQALGSQLIDGRLPRPLIDYLVREGTVEQRISIFEGGFVIVNMTGASTIRKRMRIPPEALASYIRATSAAKLESIEARTLVSPEPGRRSLLRVYRDDASWSERVFHPAKVLPKPLADQIAPLRDLLRAISEDRDVTSSIAGYEPREGDELVADDHRVYRVTRIVDLVVELKCLTIPATIYVAKKDLVQYFIGKHTPQ